MHTWLIKKGNNIIATFWFLVTRATAEMFKKGPFKLFVSKRPSLFIIHKFDFITPIHFRE